MLERHELTSRILAGVNALLGSKGQICERGTAVSSTLIATPNSPKNRIGARDPEMRQTKKGNRVLTCHFGYTMVRYRGLKKNTAQLTTLFALVNSYLLRKRFRSLQ